MKKILFLMAPFSLFILISCTNSNKSSESFANIIKNDSSRVNELLQVADSINQVRENEEDANVVDDDDVDETEALKMRSQEPLHINYGGKFSIIKIPVIKIKRYIRRNGLKRKDNLIFYLVTFKTQPQVDKFNKRNGNTKFTVKELQGMPILILKNKPDSSAHLNQTFFDAATMCPPPDDGSCGYPFR